jgi:hypothetical protein
MLNNTPRFSTLLRFLKVAIVPAVLLLLIFGANAAPTEPVPNLPTSTPAAERMASEDIALIPPLPAELPPEAELQRARIAMENALEKRLETWGIRSQVEIADIRVANSWAYGKIYWSLERGFPIGDVYILAHQQDNDVWQALLPIEDNLLYTTWLDSMSDELLSTNSKEEIASVLIDRPIDLDETSLDDPPVPVPTPVISLDFDSRDIDSKVEEQVRSLLLNELPDGYEDYDIWSLETRDKWSYMTLVRLDGENSNEQFITHLHIAIAEYDLTAERWEIYIEGTSKYEEALQFIPDWLQWLALLEEELAKQREEGLSNLTTVYSIPGLPWIAGSSWRYNQGPLTSGHLNEFDFGVPIVGVPNDVYAAESGTVVSKSGTCVWIQRPSDGLRLFYQHIRASDINNLSIGQSISYGTRLGTTTIDPGCGGTSTNHHVHFSFYSPYSGGVLNPQGFYMNGWLVQGNTLVKDGQVRTANFSDTVLHSGSAPTDQVRLYSAPNQSGTVLYTLGTGLHTNLNPPIYSMSMASGWSAITYDQSNGTGD